MDYGLNPNATGTYVKVIQHHQSFDGFGDSYTVLYLLPSDLYLYIGYWEGFELTVAAGNWKECEDCLLLQGVGKYLNMDCVPSDRSPHKHEREFRIIINNWSRALFAETEHKDWSLLSYPGYLHYLGKFYFFYLHNDNLPLSFNEIEPWTRKFLEECDSYSWGK